MLPTHKERKKSYRLSGHSLKYGVIFLGSLCLFFFIFFSRTFIIEYVDIQSVNAIDASSVRAVVFEQMEEGRFFFFPQKNIFIFSKKQLEKTLNEKFFIHSLAIKKKIPHTLSLSMDAKAFRLIWLNNEAAFDVDSEGNLFRVIEGGTASFSRIRTHGPFVRDSQASKEADMMAGVPIVYDETLQKSVIGTKVLSRDAVLFIQDAYALFVSSGYKPRYVITRTGDPTVQIIMEEGWRVLLSILEPVRPQYDHVQTVMAHTIKNNRSSLNYIDARFDNRVYYK